MVLVSKSIISSLCVIFALFRITYAAVTPAVSSKPPPPPGNFKFKYHVSYVRDKNGTLVDIKGNIPHLNITDIPTDLRHFKSKIEKYNNDHSKPASSPLEKRQQCWDNYASWVNYQCWDETDWPCLTCGQYDQVQYKNQQCYGVQANIGWDLANGLATSITGSSQSCTGWGYSCDKSSWNSLICMRSTVNYKRCQGTARVYQTCNGGGYGWNNYQDRWADIRIPYQAYFWCDSRDSWVC